MKKLLSVLAVAAMLGGCATAPGGGTAIDPQITAILAQVQATTKVACGFVPAAATVASIISAGNPGVITASAIAAAICAAIAPPTQMAREGGARTVRGWVVTPGRVNGVPVR